MTQESLPEAVCVQLDSLNLVKAAGDRMAESIYQEWTPSCQQWKEAEEWERLTGPLSR